MTSIWTVLSKIRSLGLDAAPFKKIPPEKRVGTWFLNSDKYNRLYAERRSGVKVVDLGCGPPSNRVLVRDEAGAENYIGIDFGIENQPDMVADVARLPFTSNSLDLVRVSSLLEHIYNYKEVIDELYRALRPGSSLFIETPFFLEFHGYPSDYFRYTHIAWQRILQDAGFKVIENDFECGRGLFFNLAKMLELGSIAFTGGRWFWLRFTLRALSRISWRLRRLDKYYGGSMYASAVVIAEKPCKYETVVQDSLEEHSIGLTPSLPTDNFAWRQHNLEHSLRNTLQAVHRARRSPQAQMVAWAKHLVKKMTRRVYRLKVEGTTYELFDELINGQVYEQTFRATAPGLCRVDVLFATFGRVNTIDVVFRLKESPTSEADLVTHTVPARALDDNRFYSFSFDPLPDSASKHYTFCIESPDAVRGDAVGLWTCVSSTEEGTLYKNGRPVAGQVAYTVQYAR